MIPRDHFVYRVFHQDGRLLYIGCTKNLDARWKQHCYQRPGLKLVDARFRVQGPYIKSVARTIERRALNSEAPLLGQARRTAQQRVEHVAAERQYTRLPHLDTPVLEWHRFEARPLEAFPGYWRVFSEGVPTTVIRPDDQWRIKGTSAA
ncbi:GIY-YIG nuclease family protein [Mycolicibacterium sp. XJ775]